MSIISKYQAVEAGISVIVPLVVFCLRCLAHASDAANLRNENLSLSKPVKVAPARVESLPGYNFDLPSEHFAGMCY